MIIEMHSSNCSFEIIKGGAKRIMFPCVGFASSPLSLNFRQISQVILSSLLSLITIA